MRKLGRWLRAIIFTLAVVVTMTLAVFPNIATQYVQIDGFTDESVRQAFSLLNALVLAFAGVALGRSFIARKGSVAETDFDGALATSPGSAYVKYHQPRSVAVILTRAPSFADGETFLRNTVRASILANLCPIQTSSIAELESIQKSNRVILIIGDEHFYPQLMRIAQSSSTCLVTFRPAKELMTADASGFMARMRLPESPMSDIDLSRLSRSFVSRFAMDAPRGCGFDGNWCGTYGLIALHQDKELQVTGYYYYGGGKITGRCEVDEENQRLILHYQWSQEGNESNLASRSFGQGVFIIPAGYDFFVGYWFDESFLQSSQPWSASRLSRLISEDIIHGDGEFAKDFGLSIHGTDKLKDWLKSG